MESYYDSHSEEETMAIGRSIGNEVKRGDIICLSGELGAGKTRFVKGFAEAFGISEDVVNSPTFNLIQEYSGKSGIPLYHFDCYRMKHPDEALEIGSEEYFYGDGVSIIEWPEKISAILPEDVIWIKLKISGKNSRQISVNYPTGNMN